MSVALETRGHLISGKEVRARSGATFDSVDPATAEPIAALAAGDAADVDEAVRAAPASFSAGRAPDPHDRGPLRQGLADAMADDADELAPLGARAAEKPLREAQR